MLNYGSPVRSRVLTAEQKYPLVINSNEDVPWLMSSAMAPHLQLLVDAIRMDHQNVIRLGNLRVTVFR